MEGREKREVIKPDFEAIDRGIEQALKAIPDGMKGARDLWQLRFELRRLQLLARRLELRGDRIKHFARQLRRARKANKK